MKSFFNPNLKTLNKLTDLHHPDLHLAQIFSIESLKISFTYAKANLGVKMEKKILQTKSHESQ